MTPHPPRQFLPLRYPRAVSPRAPCVSLRAASALLLFSLLLFPTSILLHGSAAAPAVIPAKNFTSPTFTKNGDWRDTLLRADEARVSVSGNEATLTGVTFTIFSGDSTNHVTTVFASPAATALLDQQILRGDQSVRVVRDDLEVSGAQWSYDHREKKVSIGQNSRIVLRAALPSLLK